MTQRSDKRMDNLMTMISKDSVTARGASVISQDKLVLIALKQPTQICEESLSLRHTFTLPRKS